MSKYELVIIHYKYINFSDHVINKLILTIVNYYTNHLIFKNGIIFELLIKMLVRCKDEKNNKNLKYSINTINSILSSS